MRKYLLAFCICCFVTLISGCIKVETVYYDDDKALARTKVELVHQLYNEGDYTTVYELLSERVKNEITKEAFVASLTKLKESNGHFIEAEETNAQVVPSGSFRRVILEYSSKYEMGMCNEGFAILIDGNDSVLDVLSITPVYRPAPSEN